MNSSESWEYDDSNVNVEYSGKIFTVATEKIANDKGQTLRMEFVICDDVVRVYPVSTLGALWLIRERRPGLRDPIVYRTVSGSLERGESPEVAAQRELGEELGMTAAAFEVFHTSTPMLKVRHTVYHVLAIDARAAPELYAPDVFEEIEPAPVALNKVEDMVWTGTFREDIIAFGLLVLLRRMKEERTYS